MAAVDCMIELQSLELKEQKHTHTHTQSEVFQQNHYQIDESLKYKLNKNGNLKNLPYYRTKQP
jgi:hypothetical protein